MSQAPRRINTATLAEPPDGDSAPTEAPASKTSLKGQPDFFQPEEPAAPQELPEAKARPEPDTRQELGLKMPAASSGGTGGNGGRNLAAADTLPHRAAAATPPQKEKEDAAIWLPLAVTLAVVARASQAWWSTRPAW